MTTRKTRIQDRTGGLPGFLLAVAVMAAVVFILAFSI